MFKSSLKATDPLSLSNCKHFPNFDTVTVDKVCVRNFSYITSSTELFPIEQRLWASGNSTKASNRFSGTIVSINIGNRFKIKKY